MVFYINKIDKNGYYRVIVSVLSHPEIVMSDMKDIFEETGFVDFKLGEAGEKVTEYNVDIRHRIKYFLV